MNEREPALHVARFAKTIPTWVWYDVSRTKGIGILHIKGTREAIDAVCNEALAQRVTYRRYTSVAWGRLSNVHCVSIRYPTQARHAS